MESLSTFMLGMSAMASLSVPVGAWLWHKNKKVLKERNQAGTQIIQLQEVLAGMPDGLYRWNMVNGVENCSARMAVLLDLPNGTASKYNDILNCFDEQSGAMLHHAVQTLHAEGTTFDIILPLQSQDDRLIQAIGQRVVDDGGDALVDLLWMRQANEDMIANGPLAQALQTAHQDRDKLLNIFNRLPLPLWIRDPSGEIIYRNGNAPVEDVSMTLGKRSMETGRELRERAHWTKNAKRCLFEISEIPLPNGEGCLGTAQDISPLEQLNKDVHRTEHVLRAVLENLKTAIAIFDGDTRLHYFNSAYMNLWGLDKNWLEERPSYAVILDHLRDNRRLPEYANYKAFRQEQLNLFVELNKPREQTLHLPDNSTLRSIISPHPVSGLIMCFEDVTQSIALQSSNKTLESMQTETLDNLFEGVAVFGGDGKLRLSNPAFGKIWDLDADFLNGQPHISEVMERCRPFYHGVSNWPNFRDRLISKIMGRITTSQRLVRSDETILEYCAQPLTDGGSLLTYMDVTDSARVEQALRQRSDAMQEADRLKSQFIANVSYEIRTPLTTLAGFADLLCEQFFGELNARQMEYAKGISESAHELTQLVADILDLATVEAGQATLELSDIDIHQTLVNVLGLLKESAKSRRLDVRFSCPETIGTWNGDEKRFKQIVFNLLSNAIRFTPLGGTVSLAAEKDQDNLIIAVTDTGKGIPKDEQERVFGSFVRLVDDEDTPHGAGLGLTLVKRFIELHNGEIELTSQPHKGTQITCRLPL